MCAIDITAEQRKTVLALLARHLPNSTAWVYGSRVKWTARPESDLDLVVFATPERAGRVSDLREAFEESNLAFRVDLFVWDDVPEQFRKQIETEQVVLVERREAGVGGEWREATLDQLGRIVTGRTPPSKIQGFFGGEIPFVTPTDLDGRRVIVSTGRSLTKKGVEAVYNSRIPARSVMVSCIGSDMGKTAIAARECVTNQQINSIVVDSGNEPLFVYYNLSNRKVEIHAAAGGSAQPILNKSGFGQFDILLPPPDQQRSIAHILGTLDDKIVLNRRMNQTLEEMARALFKSWFVDFDPVRAKATLKHHATTLPQGGSDWSVERARAFLDRLDPDIAALFPDRFVDSELGPIPEGWEGGSLHDLVELLSGGTPKTSVTQYWDGNIPWYTAKDAPSMSDVFVLETERSITQAGVENSAAKILPTQTTIITARGTVGRLACLGRPMAMNQTCYGIRGARGYPVFFTYWKVRMTVDELRRRTHGTIFDTVTRQTFKLVNSVVPPVELAGRFDKAILPVMTKMLSNLDESRKLAAVRDALLPKLIAGELRMSVNHSSVSQEVV